MLINKIRQKINFYKNRKFNSSGFTLVELMIATSLFVIIMLSALSSLLILLNESKNSRALRLAMDNVNFAMESMTRSIRMGINYYCGATNLNDLNITPRSCPDGGTIMSFIPQAKGSVQPTYRTEYRFVDNTIKRYDEGNFIDGVSIISPEVNIDNLEFFVNTGDDVQPSVYIIVKGTVTIKGVPTSFSIQALASQRNF